MLYYTEGEQAVQDMYTCSSSSLDHVCFQVFINTTHTVRCQQHGLTVQRCTICWPMLGTEHIQQLAWSTTIAAELFCVTV